MTDDLTQARIADEACAIEEMIRYIRTGAIDWLSSEVLEIETDKNPDPERRCGVQVLMSLASDKVELDDLITQRAGQLQAAGYGAFDALHLSSAEAGGAEVLLTTDDGFIRLAARGRGSPRVQVLNPIEWLRKQDL